MKELIESLESKGLKLAYIERCLGLPQRTISRWKSGEESASGKALLQIIDNCPWILEIAKNHYNKKEILHKMVTLSTEITSHLLEIMKEVK